MNVFVDRSCHGDPDLASVHESLFCFARVTRNLHALTILLLAAQAFAVIWCSAALRHPGFRIQVIIKVYILSAGDDNVSECICTLSLCCCTLYVTLSVSVSSFSSVGCGGGL